MTRIAAAFRLLAASALSLAVAVALAACVLAWRLAQGPLDVSWLVHRAQARLAPRGGELTVAAASLAWGGFGARDTLLDLRLRGVAFAMAADGPRLSLREARLGLDAKRLLLGRLSPATVEARGITLALTRRADGTLAIGPDVARDGRSEEGGSGGGQDWPDGMRHLGLTDMAIGLHDESTGLDGRLDHAMLALDETPAGGMAGMARAELAVGAAHGGVSVRATPHAALTQVELDLSGLNPADLARAVPRLSTLAALDAPVAVTASAELAGLALPDTAHVTLTAGSGTLSLGTGRTPIRQATATLSATRSALHLEAARLSLGQPAGASAPPPTFTVSADATRADGRVRASFAVAVDSVAMADLGRYWPAGTGGGARPWLVANVTAGRVHDGHVAGSLDGREDGSDIVLSALSGSLLIDDATLWWLRPVPPLVHAGGRVTIEGPDALRVTLDRGGQDRLALAPGSFIDITGLQAPHQFGDIEVGLSGPLADALALLNTRRLNLLSRGGVDVIDPAGTVKARLKLHVPMEDRVTMDDIPVAASASLSDVHLGRVVGGRDLDRARLAMTVTGDGLGMTGDGAVSGIPADLSLQMDFRAGPPGQVLQHLTASGRVSGPQLLGAGVPVRVAAVLAGGVAALRVDYAGHRDGTAIIQADADLSAARLDTPLGWSKPAGPAARAGARVLLDHGRLAGVEGLHGEGPGLAIASRTELVAGRPRALLLDRFRLGQTDAHGRIGFPSKPGDRLDVRLSGPMLDLASYLDPQGATADPGAPEKARDTGTDDDAPGPPWSVNLAFDRVQLAGGTILAPLSVQAASDGRHILHADATAGGPGELALHIVPAPGGRHLTLSAADAGTVLQALGEGDALSGGALSLDASYADGQPGAPLSGTATLDRFQLRQAATIGRVMQAMTLYGLVDALRGPGLRFSRLVAPFRWQRRVLRLSNARAFSASLGITAQGDIDLRRRVADVKGTVVPAYFFNQLLGDLPLVGRVFSPEKGGGVFAARYSVRGPFANPRIGVNPLSALTPGFLREGFGLFAPGLAAERK